MPSIPITRSLRFAYSRVKNGANRSRNTNSLCVEKKRNSLSNNIRQIRHMRNLRMPGKLKILSKMFLFHFRFFRQMYKKKNKTRLHAL